MNIIFVEVDHYANFAKGKIEKSLVGHKIYFTGNDAQSAEATLNLLTPSLDRSQKTLLVTAGTLDEETDYAGSAFVVVTHWLIDGPGAQISAEKLGVVANPAFKERLKRDFEPFRILEEACDIRNIPLLKHGKEEGIDALVKIVDEFSGDGNLNLEGGRRGIENLT